MKIAILGLASAVLLSGCATDGVGRGALIGGVGGAAVSAATGNDVVKGAAVGAVAGAVIGYVVEQGKKRELYSDGNGNTYWVDDNGKRHYQN
ncbi:outer membrane protein peptidoglycan-associatedlipoprotein [Asticcacaulis biprosthecium C19]|uniref:Outer membrane protein peptidoglycan-associatedlipoprotein n=1 Tax=Asticcacaulis biprosthecium C19 TaxID=715226 RepID=F4QJW8_9CAUL|nr:YMGG-like glycine zipper-containing protein [Asticcacaulis biprosthecium]EGF93225.1 outer membrane protein peptidoglycan-associatedlipoprotein [Asticcacaulis biprosthecium C19]